MSELKLTRDPASYNYLSQGGVTTVEGMDDKKEYADVLKALKDVGLSDDVKDTLLRIVAAVINVGQVEFEAGDNESCTVSF